MILEKLLKKYICLDTEATFVNYNFFEVSGHNHESSQTWVFCMDFLNHREGGCNKTLVFITMFL